MDTTSEWLFESWRRQSKMLNSLATLVTEDNRKFKAGDGEWSLDFHLAHIAEVRYFWLTKVSKEHSQAIGDTFRQEGDNWLPIDDLDEIKKQIAISAEQVLAATQALMEAGVTSVGGYDHPVIYLQHMLWHDGYHFGIINQNLRLAGNGTTEEWEEANVWGLWRVE